MVPMYPSLYQVNTRVWLTELSARLGRHATLDDIPEEELDRFAAMGVDWIWFLSVWTTSELGRNISRSNPEWRQDFEATLHDLREDDIAGSGFAVTDYHVHPGLGGDEALKRLRKRLAGRGLRLMLDFVPNHMGPGHQWVEEHPDYFISGSETDLSQAPQNYTRVKTKQGDLILAFGRDPYFSGWPDTLQLDYSNPAASEAMAGELLRISGQCDGVRCDMAMLVLPEVFERTWGRKAQNFWPIIIKAVRDRNPGFCFLAEVYWDMEWTLQQQGFDYAYDKRLYDRLVEGHARAVREHFYAGLDYQNKLARFLENHDESRAAATFDLPKHEAAALITFLSPGLRFFHQGEFEGRKKRISPHLVRAPQEPVIEEVRKFYNVLLSLIRKPAFRNGKWQMVEPVPAWAGNDSWDSFISFLWEGEGGIRFLVAVNFSPDRSQCFIRLPLPELAGQNLLLADHFSEARFERNGDELLGKGLYLDMTPWQYHVLELKM